MTKPKDTLDELQRTLITVRNTPSAANAHIMACALAKRAIEQLEQQMKRADDLAHKLGVMTVDRDLYRAAIQDAKDNP